MGEETIFAQFREKKYEMFDWDLQDVNANLHLVQNPESQSTRSVLFCNYAMQF